MQEESDKRRIADELEDSQNINNNIPMIYQLYMNINFKLIKIFVQVIIFSQIVRNMFTFYNTQ